MPIYEYKCPECGGEDEVVRPMTESDEPRSCECGATMERKFSFHCAKDRYSKPLVSDSLAVPVHQIAEHRHHFPDIEMTKEGQPVFHNYTEHDNYLKKTGFVKQTKKPRRKVKSVLKIKS